MRDADSAQEFFSCEVEIHAMARELGDEYTASILREVVADEGRTRAAASRLRESVADRRLTLVSQGRKPTRVQLLGGSVISLAASYMLAKAEHDAPLPHRGKAGTGVFPVLDELGITDRATPALRLRVSHAVCEANSVADARELMRQSGLDVTHKVALRLTYAVSNLALASRARAIKATRAGNDEGEFAGRKIVATVDGGRVRVRTALRGRPKKGGRRRFRRDWREPRVLAIYVLGEDGKRDKRVRTVIDATLSEADDVYELMLYHLRRVGAHRAASLTVIADGAKWIWKRASTLKESLGLGADVPFTEVVDYYHVVERLYEFARSRRRWTEKRVHRWVRRQKNRLKRGWVDRVTASVAELLTKTERKKGTVLDYWHRNRARLQYAAFRSAGVPIGSGAVESAVRRVVNLRLKSASTVWKEESAEGVMHLRAYSKAGRWQEIEDAILQNCSWSPRARRPRRAA